MQPWVPISKYAVEMLPKDRPFTKVEAILSLQLDHNNGTEVSVMGMSKRWGWTRKKVRVFLEHIGVEIVYPKSTAKYRNQRGHIRGHKRDISPQKRGHIIFIDFNQLKAERDISPQKRGHKGAISGATTIEKEKEENKNCRASSKTSGSSPKKNGIPYDTIIQHLNDKAGKNFRSSTEATRRAIRARGREGFGLEEFKTVIDGRCDKWFKYEKMVQYLRPQTLFGPKFESYFNAGPSMFKEDPWDKF